MNLILIETIPLLQQAVCQTIESKPEKRISDSPFNRCIQEYEISESQLDLLGLDIAILEAHDRKFLQTTLL